MFAKAGEIVPILKNDNCKSILDCIDKPIMLKVFLTEDQTASGTLYLDDGETYNPQGNERAHISYVFNGEMLSAENILETSYSFPGQQRLFEAVFYGLKQKPTIIVVGGYQTREVIYNDSEQMLFVNGLFTSLDNKNLVELVFT